MIHDGLVVLIHYGLYLIPGLLLCGLWFYLVPKNQPALRIAILLLTFVLLRDAMTPLGLWSLSGDLQIGFIANPFVLAMLGGLSLGPIAGGVQGQPDCRVDGGRRCRLPDRLAIAAVSRHRTRCDCRLLELAAWDAGVGLWGQCAGLEQQVTPLRAALISAVAFSACHSFLALTVTQLGWPVLAFTLLEGVACGLVRMRYGVVASTATHGTAILLIAVPMAG